MTEESKKRRLDDAKEWINSQFKHFELVELIAEAIATGNGFKDLIEMLECERENFLSDYDYK